MPPPPHEAGPMHGYLPPKPMPRHGPAKPPHELGKKKQPVTIIYSVIIGIVLSAIVGAVLYLFGISINVILPVLAPIFVGTITMTYTIMGR